MTSKTPYHEKLFREQDRKSARDDAERAKKTVLSKTAKLKALRLAKEASDRVTAAEAGAPAPKKKRAAPKPRFTVPARRRG